MIRKCRLFTLTLIAAASIAVSVSSFAAPLPSTGTTEVFFSPNGGCTDAIVKEISGAKQEILVQAYSFTSVPIAKALLAASKRGVRIEAVLDATNRPKPKKGKKPKTSYSAATFLKNANIPVLIDDAEAIGHNKILIIDRATLITGSFNFSKQAEEKNAENLLILKGNKPLVEKYLKNYEEHKRHSEAF